MKKYYSLLLMLLVFSTITFAQQKSLKTCVNDKLLMYTPIEELDYNGKETYTYYDQEGEKIKHGKYTLNGKRTTKLSNYQGSINLTSVYKATTNFVDGMLNGLLSISNTSKGSVNGMNVNVSYVFTGNFKKGIPTGAWQVKEYTNGEEMDCYKVNFSNGKLIGAFSSNIKLGLRAKGTFASKGKMNGTWDNFMYPEAINSHDYKFINNVLIYDYYRDFDGTLRNKGEYNQELQDLATNFANKKITQEELEEKGYVLFKDSIDFGDIIDCIYKDAYHMDIIGGIAPETETLIVSEPYYGLVKLNLMTDEMFNSYLLNLGVIEGEPDNNPYQFILEAKENHVIRDINIAFFEPYVIEEQYNKAKIEYINDNMYIYCYLKDSQKQMADSLINVTLEKLCAEEEARLAAEKKAKREQASKEVPNAAFEKLLSVSKEMNVNNVKEILESDIRECLKEKNNNSYNAWGGYYDYYNNSNNSENKEDFKEGWNMFSSSEIDTICPKLEPFLPLLSYQIDSTKEYEGKEGLYIASCNINKALGEKNGYATYKINVVINADSEYVDMTCSFDINKAERIWNEWDEIKKLDPIINNKTEQINKFAEEKLLNEELNLFNAYKESQNLIVSEQDLSGTIKRLNKFITDLDCWIDILKSKDIININTQKIQTSVGDNKKYVDILNSYNVYKSTYNLQIASDNLNETIDRLHKFIAIQNQSLEFVSCRKKIDELDFSIWEFKSDFKRVLKLYKGYMKNINTVWSSEKESIERVKNILKDQEKLIKIFKNSDSKEINNIIKQQKIKDLKVFLDMQK